MISDRKTKRQRKSCIELTIHQSLILIVICTIPGTKHNLPSCIYRGTNFGEEKIVKTPKSDETPSNRNAVVLYKKELNLLLKLLQESVIKDGHGGSEQRDCQ